MWFLQRTGRVAEGVVSAEGETVEAAPALLGSAAGLVTAIVAIAVAVTL